MLNKIIAIVGGTVGVAAAWTGHQHVAAACILTMCGLYFANRCNVLHT